MLYQLHELNRSFLTPLTKWAQASSKMFANPISPLAYTPYSQRIAAAYELVYRLGKDYEKPAFNIDSVQIGEQHIDIVEENTVVKPFCKLINFKKNPTNSKRDSKISQQRKVLIVAPLSGHHATLLRDTVKSLLPHYDVYITDWIDARMVPLSAGPFHLHDYIYYVQEFIRGLGPDLHVISVCQPTVPVLMSIRLATVKSTSPKKVTELSLSLAKAPS